MVGWLTNSVIGASISWRDGWITLVRATKSYTCWLVLNSHPRANNQRYYIRRSRGSDKWIVFLEGGWYCFDHMSCSERSRVMPDYMSSRNWPRYRSGSGILSWDPEENPYYFHANIVYIPYCSSDSWTGTRNSTTSMKFSFMGSLILDEVFNELLKKGMRRAQTVLIAGTSAGATGVLVNIDRISALIHAKKSSVDVRGLVDSGWFLDMEPFKEKLCRDAFTCSPIAGMQRGVQVWNPRLPKQCVDTHPKEIWRCYFGRRVFPSIKTPVYIIQNLYDAAQIQVSNVLEEQHTWPRGDLSSDQWRYLLDLGQQVKDTLKNVSAVFAPGCVSHEILNKPEWHNVRIEGTSLAESIYCWETRHSSLSSCQQPSMNSMLSKNSNSPLADSPPSSRKKRKRGRKRRKNKGKKRRKNRDKKRKNAKSRRLSRAANKKCHSHLIDLCPWPHCNCSCPKCRWETLNKAEMHSKSTRGQSG
ncbi:hypothetical protein RRG08_002723 [Elysia crispata]|uniref:Uncharacterized protein n=1 Tax=Elysia crispata TaxID=231223 RepID=A0AAE0XUA5_9GAST|nr:hypothetical protein RRG08_002723 [Elysia crispata]